MAARLYVPDEALLRRFGIVRAVGGAAYVVAVAVLFAIYGAATWPLLLGVPVLAVVTFSYFLHSQRYPRTAVAASLIADALVLGGSIAFVGGTGSGTAAVYVIVITSAGILLGPTSAAAFTALTVVLAWLQLLGEQAGIEPRFLHREALDERVVVLLITTGVLISVGYLTGTYASRLQQGLLAAGDEAEAVRRRGRRRHQFVRQASVDVRGPLRAVEEVADRLEDPDLDAAARRRLAASLRMRTAELDAEVQQLAEVGALDETEEARPEPVLLSRVVDDCLVELGGRLDDHHLVVDVEPLKVLGDRRGARRIVFNLLENVARHTPAGTAVQITTHRTASQGVLAVADDGPGIPTEVAARLFDPPDEGGGPRVGLPLVAALAAAMDAEIRYAPRRAGGSRFLVGFRLAPRDAPVPEEASLPPTG